MRSKCILVACGLTFVNIAIGQLTSDLKILIPLMSILNLGAIWVLYILMTAPMHTMKKRIDEIKKENQRIENKRHEFVANVTHELKTPLTSISGFVETLQAGAVEDADTRDKFLEIIAIETARLKRLINDILTLSDIEGNISDNKTKIHVYSITEAVFDMLEPVAKERNITMINNIDPGIYVYGNEDKFKQMIVNLTENAIKYGKDDGHVWVEGKTGKRNIYITVKDDGIGISNKDVDRVVERFYRVDKSRSNKVGGTGLGLSIVKHTAKLFNGKLSVESKLGEGSEFIITIKK